MLKHCAANRKRRLSALPNVGPYIYTTLIFLALQVAPYTCIYVISRLRVKVKQSSYRPEQAQRVDRSIALPFRDLGVRRGVWSASHPGRFTPRKDPVPIVQEAGWVPRPVCTTAKNLAHTGIRSPDRPARSQSLYRLSYPCPIP
jgi:hypothetical protein